MLPPLSAQPVRLQRLTQRQRLISTNENLLLQRKSSNSNRRCCHCSGHLAPQQLRHHKRRHLQRAPLAAHALASDFSPPSPTPQLSPQSDHMEHVRYLSPSQQQPQPRHSFQVAEAPALQSDARVVWERIDRWAHTDDEFPEIVDREEVDNGRCFSRSE